MVEKVSVILTHLTIAFFNLAININMIINIFIFILLTWFFDYHYQSLFWNNPLWLLWVFREEKWRVGTIIPKPIYGADNLAEKLTNTSESIPIYFIIALSLVGDRRLCSESARRWVHCGLTCADIVSQYFCTTSRGQI